jgi:shikimate dehydrogenase
MTAPTPLRFAVAGNPVAHSRSPAIHALFGRQTGITLAYTTLLAPLDDFAATVERFFNEGGTGLNVTVPFKEQAFALAQPNVSERARIAQAANTLWMLNGKLHACNTDGVGLLMDLTRLGHDPRGKRILLVGAGGAARGVSAPLLDAGCALLHIVNRTAQRAHDLVDHLRTHRPDTAGRLQAGDLQQARGPYDIVINATSGSLHHQAPTLPAGLYSANALAYDMVYGSQPTAFMLQAGSDGAAQTADGLGMLAGQAAESFRLWHGVMPDVQATLTAVRALVNKG